MSPLTALTYSFLLGLLHGILPDEHTWPITLSYAIGGASGKAGLKAGLYFSAAFTVQRMLLAELSCLALTPFLLSPTINGIVYFMVGLLMAVAGAVVLRQQREPHLHLLGHRFETTTTVTTSPGESGGSVQLGVVATPRPRWTIIHGFVAGFGLEGFAIFANTVAAPAMPNAWLGFLPGLLFGLGTMLILAVIGTLFGASLRWSHLLTEPEIKRVGAQTGGRTLFFGGLLFSGVGLAMLLGLDQYLPVEAGYLLIGLFMVGVTVPAFVVSLRQVLVQRKNSQRWLKEI